MTDHVSNAQRDRLVSEAHYLINLADRIHYAEIRPTPNVALPTWAAIESHFRRGESLTTDCSGMVTAMFKWAGLRDPNGRNYDGTGNTDTLYDHLPHYHNVEDAHPGALLIFGVAPTVHVCMLMERDGVDPYLFSHGQEAGPFHIRLSEERQGHVGQAETWLNISHL